MLVVAQAYKSAKQYGEVPYPPAALSRYASPLGPFQRGQPIEGSALAGIMEFIKDIAAYKNDARKISEVWMKEMKAFNLPSPFKAGQVIGNATEATLCYFRNDIGVIDRLIDPSRCEKWPTRPTAFQAEPARRQNMMSKLAQRAGMPQAQHQQYNQQRRAQYPGYNAARYPARPG